MTTQNIEQRKQRIETVVKIGLIGVAGFLVAPIILSTIAGIAGLAIAGLLGFAIVQFAPAVAALVSTWRLKAIKAIAAANPIETLENRYSELKDALLKQRDNIKQRIAIASKIYDQIKSFELQFDKPSPRRDQYNKLNQLVELGKSKYQNAQLNLVAFGKVIDEKRADWEIACSIAESNKLANIGEDFTAKLMADTALTTIQDGLNTAFAELDAAVMDENIQKVLDGKTAEVTVAPVADAKPTKKLSAPSDLDFDSELPSQNTRQKIAV